MSVHKCATVGCHNEVARQGDQCGECKQRDLSYGLYE